MNYFWLSSFITAIVSFIMGLFVYSKNYRNTVNRQFMLVMLSVSLWSFGLANLAKSSSSSEGLFWDRFLYCGSVFIPSTFFHFIVAILGTKDSKKNIVLLGYFLSLIFFVLNFTYLFRKYMFPATETGINYLPRVGFIYNFFLLFYAFYLIYAHILLWKGIKQAALQKRNQLKYVLSAALIGFAGGLTTFFPPMNIRIPPIGNYFVIIYIFILTYAIVRHQLMEIEVIIKKTLVFAGMFVFAFGVFVTITLLVSRLIGGNSIISLAVSALIITIFLRPLETWLVNSTDKFLFQKKYEYKQILKAFIDEVIMVLNLDEVVSSTLKLLDQTLHPYTSAIFILNKAEDKYQLYNASGLEDKSITFSSDSRLVTFLKTSKDPAVIKQIDGIIGVSPEIAGEMARLKALVVLPLMLHNDLIGFISLGKKKSDEEYTKEDLEVLLDLARTESIAISNAQLITEAAQSERRAAIGTMAAGIYHEIGNPLNIINTKIQVFLVGIERGFYNNMSRDEIIQECRNILNDTLSQTNRIADITRRLSNFAKPSKEFKPQLVNVPEEIDEAIAVVSHDLELERIKIDKIMPLDLPQVLADRREMQQIFFNLIRNAAQAIEETGVITVKGLTTQDSKVRIEIQDTGEGIPEEKKNRIFEPFFTTKGPKGGTGLGLSIVRQLVWRNRGEISFNSLTGIGTTFILEFPKGA